MYYSAESVIAALKENNALHSNDYDKVKCPSPCPFSPVHEKDCPGDPSICIECNNRVCDQNLLIYCDPEKKVLLRIFVFLFMISAQNNGGFIHNTDSVLMQFIRKKLIDQSKLKIVDL